MTVSNKNSPDAYYQEMYASYKAYNGNEPYIFLSYSHADFENVKPFLDLLKRNHFRFWFDEGIKSGVEWADEISKKIRGCLQFIVFISANSIQSDNVKDEVHIAYKYGIEIIRIHLDETELHGGLELKLDRKQALYKHKYEQLDLEDRFCSALNIKTVYSKSDISQGAKKLLNEQYEISNCIGTGGTARVYIGKRKSTGSAVVIKSATIEKSQIGNSIKEYFCCEKSILSQQISHFVPQVFDFYSDETSVYLVESFIDGTSLREMKHLTVDELVRIIIETAKVLKRYHENGIIHCDIKPKHIICNQEGCFLIDFGASRRINEKNQPYIMGTPGYAAPEQLSTYIDKKEIYENTTMITGEGGNIDGRTDIFGLGRTLKRMLRVIYSGDIGSNKEVTAVLFNLSELSIIETTSETANDKSGEDNSSLFNIPDPLLRAIVDKMTRHKKEDRFNSMEEVIEVLTDYLQLRNA